MPNLSAQAKKEIIKIIDESTPEEAEKMVTNMEWTLGRIYEEGKNDSVIAGKMEGKIESKMEVAKNLLSKNIAEDLVSETTGLPIEQIRKIKAELH